jgi:hypothetical protein
MLRQEELAFIKAISTMQPSPALLKELRAALASSKKKKTVDEGAAAPRSVVGLKLPSVLQA